MSMTENLEKDREKLLYDLSGGKTPALAVQIVQKEMDRLLIKYNSEEEEPARRSAASQMTEAVKAFLPAIDGIGDTKLWEREMENKRKKSGPGILFLILLLLSILLLGATVFAMLRAGADLLVPESLTKYRTVIYGIPFVAGLFCFLTGLRLGTGYKPATNGKEQKLEVYVDGEKIYRILHATALVMDRELKNVTVTGPEALSDGEERTVTAEEIELYSSVFEAGYAEEDGSLSECMENLRFFLHKKGIETEDYSPEHAGWFELMPGKETATVRPALTRDGELLRRGIAVTG